MEYTNTVIQRNNLFLKLINKKLQLIPKDSVDIIGIVGSFYTGDYHEKSDLDLCIVSDNPDAQKLATCFILKDVGYDFYISPWSKLEELSTYSSPFIAKLFEILPVYKQNEVCWDKFLQLRSIALKELREQANCRKKAATAFGKALYFSNQLRDAEDIGRLLRLFNDFMTEIEFSLYFLNQTYIKRGIKRIPDEIEGMPLKPNHFMNNYRKAFQTSNPTILKNIVELLVKELQEYLENTMSIAVLPLRNREDTPSVKSTKPQIQASQLIGTYEEIYSNWRNKMKVAETSNDHYLSFRTLASCQSFYDEMMAQYDLPSFEILSKFNPNDLPSNSAAFEHALRQWKVLYEKNGIQIRAYNSMDDFSNAYLNL